MKGSCLKCGKITENTVKNSETGVFGFICADCLDPKKDWQPVTLEPSTIESEG